MIPSNKLTYLAISVTVFWAFGAGLGANLWYASTQPQSVNRYCSYYDDPSAANDENSVATQIAPTDARSDEVISKPPSEKEKYDLCQQWRMAEAAQQAVSTAWLQAFISMGGLLGLILTVIYAARSASAAAEAAEAAKNSVDITRLIGQKQVRAYLSCEQGQYLLSNERLHCGLKIKNNGQSPAKDIKVAAKIIDISSKGISSINLENTFDLIIDETGFMSATSTENIDLTWRESYGTVSERCVQSLFDFGGRFALRCDINWRDVFGDPQEITILLISDKINEQPTRGSDRAGTLTRYNMGIKDEAQKA